MNKCLERYVKTISLSDNCSCQTRHGPDKIPRCRSAVEPHQFRSACRLDPAPHAECSGGSHRNQCQSCNDLTSALDCYFIHLHFELLMLQGICLEAEH